MSRSTVIAAVIGLYLLRTVGKSLITETDQRQTKQRRAQPGPAQRLDQFPLNRHVAGLPEQVHP